MKTGVLLTMLLAFAAVALPSEIVVFSDGTQMEVDSYEVRGNVIVVTTLEGGLRSLPATYVDLEATVRANERGSAAPTVLPAAPTVQPAPPPAVDTTTAPTAPTDPVALARQALELYGEREFFVAIQLQAGSVLAPLEGNAPKDLYDLMMDGIRRGFDPDVLMERSASSLGANADEALLADWLRWLETPTIRAITEAEMAADRPDSAADREQFLAGLAQFPPTASRERLVTRLMQALSLTERSFEMYQLGQDSVQEGLLEVFPAAANNAPAQSTEELRASVLPRIEERTRQSLFYKYRDIADPELESYVSYWESEAGQAIDRSLESALNETLRYAGRTAGRILGEEGKPFLEAAAQAQVREVAAEPQVFEALNFRFTPPAGSAWVSLNAKTVNEAALLGYLRRNPDINLLIFAEDVGGVDEFTTEAAAEVASAGLESAAQSYRLVSSEPSTVNGIAGLRLVSEAVVINRNITYVQWICSRNGYVFQLVAYATSATASDASFYEEVDKVFSGFELVDPERVANAAAGISADYHSERYGYGLSLAGTGWAPWPELGTDAPSADFGGLHSVHSAFMVVPVTLRGLDPSLAVLAEALLSVMDIPFSETTRRAEQPTQAQAYELGYEREFDGSVYEYRLHIRKTPAFGYLVAAWTNKDGSSQPKIDAIVDSFRVDPEAPAAQGYSAWTLRERSSHAQILNEMGLDYLEQDQAPRATELLEAAFALNPEDPQLLENLVAAVARTGDDAAGLALLDEHLERFPDVSSLASYRPYFQKQLGMDDEAAGSYRELFDSGYRNEFDLSDYTDVLWELGRADEALAIVASYRKVRDSPAAAQLEAKLHTRNGDGDRAIAIIAAQYEALPNDIDLARQLIDAYYDAQQYERSLELSAELLASGHETSDLHFRQALNEMALGRYQEAKHSLEGALDLSPGNADAREYLDYVSGILGEGDHEALRHPIPPVAFPEHLKQPLQLDTPIDAELVDYGAYYESAVTAISFKRSVEFRQTDFYRIHIVDAKAVPLFNTFRFGFDPLRERIHVNSLEVRDASGELVLEGSRSDYYVVDDSSESIASQKQSVTIPVRGLAVGHTIVLSVTRQSASPPAAMPYIRHSFSMSTPVLRSQLYVTGDVDALEVRSANVPPESVASEAISWTMERPPVYRRESAADFSERYLPFVWITDKTRSWESLAAEYLNDIRERLASDPEAAALARSLTADSTTDEQRIQTIARYVQDNYTYQAVAFGRAAWLPNPVGQIIENKYGDCKDHALLFYQLLQALEVPVELVLIHSSLPVQSEIPSLEQFDHMIAFVPGYQKGHYFDLTDKGYDTASMSTPLGLGGSMALLLDETTPRLVELPEYSSDSSVATLVRQVSVVDTDVDVHETVTMNGYYASFWRSFLVDADSQTRHRLVQNQMGRSAAVRVVDVSAENLDEPQSPLILNVDYRIDNAFNRVEGKLVGKVPAVWERQLLELDYAENRKTPYRIAYPLTVTSEVSLVAPSGYRVGQGAEPISSPDGELVDWTIDFELDPTGILLRYEHRRTPRRGTAAEYEDLRHAVDRSLDAVEATWVLEAADP